MSVFKNGQKTELFNGVHVYGNDVEITEIKTLVSELEKIWENIGDIVNLPKRNRMTILLHKHWKFIITPKLNQKIFTMNTINKK